MNYEDKKPSFGYTLVTTVGDSKIVRDAFHHDAREMVYFIDAIDKSDEHFRARSVRQTLGYVQAEFEGESNLRLYVVDNKEQIMDDSGLVSKLLSENPSIPTGIQDTLRRKYHIVRSEEKSKLHVSR